jgi:NADH-quinone oxidoreductase subunit N
MSALSTDLALLRPELTLLAFGLVMLLICAFRGDKAAKSVITVGVVGLLICGFFLSQSLAEHATAFNGVFISDKFATVMKFLVLGGAILALLLGYAGMDREDIGKPEFPTLVIFSVLGMLIMVSANDLLTLYIGFELQSLALYVLAAFRRDSARSSEAGLKYFVLGALSSGLLLYGASLIYGFTGTTSFDQLAQILSAGSRPAMGLVIGLIFLISGLAFKVSAVPFHMWTPDVYEGAPTPITAFFAMAPKVAAMALFTRVLFGPFGHMLLEWQHILWFLSAASMVVGSLGAIWQSNIKRLMAYSSIANVGFALIGLTTGTQAGVQGMIVYMAIYIVMTAGTFGIIHFMNQSGKPVEAVQDLAGLSRTRPWLAAAMLLFMFSYAGIPPLAGFFAKLYVFLPAIEAHFYILAVLGVLASVVGAYYYLRIIKIMYFDEPVTAFDDKSSLPLGVVLVFSVAVMLLFIVVPVYLVDQAGQAAQSLVPG